MKRFYKNWPMHNIVAHPLMQILEWIGLVSMADKLHDATLPPNVEVRGATQLYRGASPRLPGYASDSNERSGT